MFKREPEYAASVSEAALNSPEDHGNGDTAHPEAAPQKPAIGKTVLYRQLSTCSLEAVEMS